MGIQGVDVQGQAGGHFDKSMAHLAPARIGHAHHGGGAHAGEALDGGFHLGRVDILAAADIHVFFAVHHIMKTGGVAAEQITGFQPAAGKQFGAGVWPPPVARTQGRPSQPQLAHPIHGHILAGLIDNARLRAPVGKAHRAAMRHRVGFWQGQAVHPGFGQAVALLEGQPTRRPVLDQRNRAGRAARDAKAQAVQFRCGKVGVVGQHLEHGRHGKQHAQAPINDGAQHLAGVKTRQQHAEAAALQERQGQHIQPASMKKRRMRHAAVRAGQIPGQRGVVSIGRQHALRQQGALGPAGGARGVQQQERGFRVDVRRGVQRRGQPVVQRGQRRACRAA